MIREHYENLLKSSEESGDCEKVMGMEGLYVLAGLYEQNSHLLQLIETDCLINWNYEEDFSSRDTEVFKRGLFSILGFMKRCHEEKDLIEKKKLAQPQEEV